MDGLFEGIVGGSLGVLLLNIKFKENKPIWLRSLYLAVIFFVLFSVIEVLFRESSITTFWDTLFGFFCWIYLPITGLLYLFWYGDKLREEHKD